MTSNREDTYRIAIRRALSALESVRAARHECDLATASLVACLELTPLGESIDADLHERKTLPKLQPADHAADFDGADTDRPSFSELVGGCEEEGDVEPAAGDIVYVSMASLGP